MCGYGCLTDHSALAQLVGASLKTTAYHGGSASEAHASAGSVVQFQETFFDPPGENPVDHDGHTIDAHPWTAHYFCSHALRFSGFTKA